MSNGTSVKIQHLDALAALLEAQGLTPVRRYDTAPARVIVENRDLRAGDEPVMSECVTVRSQETTVVFCWRAGDPIGPVDDIEAAATKIVSVLTLAELAEGMTGRNAGLRRGLWRRTQNAGADSANTEKEIMSRSSNTQNTSEDVLVELVAKLEPWRPNIRTKVISARQDNGDGDVLHVSNTDVARMSADISRHVLMDGSVELRWLDGLVLKGTIEQMAQAIIHVLCVAKPERDLLIAGSF